MDDQGKTYESQTDRLMADLRIKVSAMASAADRSVEDCVAFSRKEADYAEWRKRHIETGYVLHRDTAASKSCELHVAACPAIGGDDDGLEYTKSPKVGCPTREAAMQFARLKKWKVKTTCDQCPE